MANPARLQLKITPDHVEPAVWRRVVVSDSLTFLQLHDVIQRAMGWEDCNMHEFELAGPRIRIGTDEPDGFKDSGEGEPCLPEHQTRLADFMTGKRKLRYWYDFGDDWWHMIAIEKRLAHDASSPAAELVAGQGACPPEDCGGPSGFAEMMAAAADPADPEYGEIREWLGDFDATAFDLEEHAKRVRAIGRTRRKRAPPPG